MLKVVHAPAVGTIPVADSFVSKLLKVGMLEEGGMAQSEARHFAANPAIKLCSSRTTGFIYVTSMVLCQVQFISNR